MSTDAATPADVRIRAETVDDVDAIRAVVSAAFGSQAEADLVERIRASPEYVAEMALVAELRGDVVGHVMVSGARIERGGDARRIVMLSPLAVAPDRQGRGIGGALVRAVADVADRRGEPRIVLEGSPTYYARFGFEHAVEYGIELPLPDWAPSEAAQVLRLSGDDGSLQGSVVYPPAFDGLDGDP